MLDPKQLLDWILRVVFDPEDPEPMQVEDWLMYENMGNDAGGVGFHPDGAFVRSLLGGDGDVGLFIAQADPAAPRWGTPPFYDHNAGEMVIGYLLPVRG